MEICTHMEFKDIVAIAGMPGLYKIVGQRQNGLIVEALDGSGKKIPTSATTKVSILSEIAMFTMDGEERLGKVVVAPGRVGFWAEGDDELNIFAGVTNLLIFFLRYRSVIVIENLLNSICNRWIIFKF